MSPVKVSAKGEEAIDLRSCLETRRDGARSTASDRIGENAEAEGTCLRVERSSDDVRGLRGLVSERKADAAKGPMGSQEDPSGVITKSLGERFGVTRR